MKMQSLRRPAMKFLKLAALFLPALFLSGCGYSAGSLNKSGVTRLNIPVFKNHVYEPNLGVLLTGTVVKRFQMDGSIQIADEQDADAVLKGAITKFELSPARFRVETERTVREYILYITVSYSVTKKGDQRPFQSGEVSGSTSFFVGDDLASDKRQGISYAAEEIGGQLVTKVTEGW